MLPVSCGDWRNNSCLDKDGYLGIERAGTGGRGRKGGWDDGVRGVRHGGSKVLSP
jgi:hypothetical protein